MGWGIFGGKKTKIEKASASVEPAREPSDQEKAQAIYDRHFSTLRERFGHDPKDSDIQWSVWHEELDYLSQSRKWGLVRNKRLQMAQFLAKEKRPRDAVLHYLVVLIFDASGPNNMPDDLDRYDDELIREYKVYDFNGQNSEILPGVAGRLLTQAEKAGMSLADIEELYRTQASRFHMPIMLLSVDETWAKISAALK